MVSTTVGKEQDEIIELFDHIGELRNVYTIGGEIDYDKVSEIIVQDIRNELLGKLTFDSTEIIIKRTKSRCHAHNSCGIRLFFSSLLEQSH